MTDPWSDDIEHLRRRMMGLIERADLGDDTLAVASEALEELAVVVEEMQAQNSELITSRSDLESERERYRNLFETVPDGYIVTDARGIMREVNATAAELFGQPRPRLIGKALASLVEPPDRRAYYAHLSRLTHSGPGSRMSLNLMVHDGVTVPVNLRASVTPASVDPVEIRWLVHDRRDDLAVREVRDNEERLRSLFDTASVGVVMTNARGQVVFANQFADSLLAREPGDVEPTRWLRSTHPDDRSALLRALRAAREDGVHTSIRHRVCHAPDEILWIEHGVSPFRSDDGVVTGSVSTLTNVTAEHVATTELGESRDFMDAVLNTVGALVLVSDPTGVIHLFNEACERVSGYPADEIIGRPFDVLLPPESLDEMRRRFEQVASGGATVLLESDWLSADGSRHTISWTYTTLSNPDGSVRAIIGTGTDITDMRQLETRLHQADRLESVGRLAAGVAHDINNTLSTLRLRLDRLVRRTTDEASMRDLNAATATIDRTQRVIADLLSFGRQQQLAPRAVDINAECERMFPVLTELLDTGIEVSLRLTEDLCVATIDPGRFEHILTNLAINARDAMSSGGTLTIETSVEAIASDDDESTHTLSPGEYVRVRVTDTGAGISAQDIPHVFDPYFTTKPPARGTGLGLATTYGTVNQTGGAIIVESEPGAGTTFSFWLPRSTADQSNARGTDGTAGTDGAGKNLVLIVEDDEDVRQVLVEEITQLGYHILAAVAGDEVLDYVDTPIGILVADVQLPDLSGPEIAARFRQHLPDLSVVFISGASDGILRAFLPADECVLRKPFTSTELADALPPITAEP